MIDDRKGDRCLDISCFVAGMISTCNNPKNYFEEPISVLFRSLVGGSITSLFGGLVLENRKPIDKYVIAGLLGVSSAYYLGKGIYEYIYEQNNN